MKGRNSDAATLPTKSGRIVHATRRVTASQVAKLARVAPTTVSAILNDRPHCYASQDTRQRVWQAAHALGYRPNLAARALLGHTTNTLGVVAPGYAIETTAVMLQHVEAMARDDGYVAISCVHMNEPQTEDQAIIHLRERFVDGLVIYPASSGEHRELRRLLDDGVPVVTLNGGDLLAQRVSDVSVDNIEGGRLQARHLIERGCRRLCLLRSACQSGPIIERAIGVTEVVAQHPGVHLVQYQVDVPHDSNQYCGELAYEQIVAFFKSHAGELDGVIASNDLFALTAMRALTQLGARVPQDCAVIGFDANAFTAICPVSLSSMAQQRRTMARKAIDLLLEQIKNPASQRDVKRLRVAPELVIRESTAAAAKPHV